VVWLSEAETTNEVSLGCPRHETKRKTNLEQQLTELGKQAVLQFVYGRGISKLKQLTGVLPLAYEKIGNITSELCTLIAERYAESTLHIQLRNC